MVKTDNYKFGFSLLEALIVMAIASIFIAVMANVVPHKPKAKLSAEVHGGFECYWNDGTLYSRTITVNNEDQGKPVVCNPEEECDHCEFRPPQALSYMIFNAVGGGSYGGVDNGGGAGQYTSAFVSIPQKVYRLYPGKGGTSGHHDGYETTVKPGLEGNDTIVNVSGGNDATTAIHTKITDIVDIQATGMASDTPQFGCTFSPRAWVGEDDKIHVQYCTTKTTVTEKTLNYSTTSGNIKTKYQTIITSPVVGTGAGVLSGLRKNKNGTYSNNTWEYYDIDVLLDNGYDPANNNLPKGCTFDKIIEMNDPMCPSRYKLTIKLNIPDNGENGATSELTKYAELLGYSGLKNIKPGNGGAINSNGNDGAVLVSW